MIETEGAKTQGANDGQAEKKLRRSTIGREVDLPMLR